MSDKRKELVGELQQIRKEHSSAFFLSKEIQELVSMAHSLLIREKLVDDPKEIDPSWYDSLEWKLIVYEDYIKEINKVLEKYFDILVQIKDNFNALEVDLTDGFNENVLDLANITREFK